MRCDAMRGIKVRTVSCHVSPQRRQSTNFDYRMRWAANHGNQSPPPTSRLRRKGAEPALRIPGRHLVGCNDRQHHVMWCVGARCQIKRQPVEACSCHTRNRSTAHSAACVVRLTDCSKVWPWERVRLAAWGGDAQRRVPSYLRSRWRLWKLSQAPLRSLFRDVGRSESVRSEARGVTDRTSFKSGEPG